MRRLLRLSLLALALAAPLAAEQWGFWDYGPGAFGDQAWKEPVTNAAALPASGNEIGDVRVTLDDFAAHVWDGDSWEAWASGGGGSGTVTSVALAVPAEWMVSGSPITTLGTITIAEATQTANTVYAGPTTGAAAAPGFRALVDDDLPAAALADDQTATEVAYTPTTGASWVDPDPTQVGGGLDDLAARLTTEEAKADDDVPDAGEVAVSAIANGTAGQLITWDANGVAATVAAGTAAQVLTSNGAGAAPTFQNAGASSGDVVGPASCTDNAIARFDSTTGKLIQCSSVPISDTGSIAFGSGTDGAGSAAYLRSDVSRRRGIHSGDAGTSPVFYYDGNTGDTVINRSFSGAAIIFKVGDVEKARIATGGGLQSLVTVEANTAGSGAPNVITATESGTLFTNEGATAENYENLPAAVAGVKVEQCVQDSDGMRFVAASGDTIRVLDKVTAAAGYISSTTIGSCVTLKAINATEWFATEIHGIWTDGTFTFDDTGLTTP